MKKIIFREDLNSALIEPSENVATQAASKGLQHVGFGRYEDPDSEQITHVAKNDKLVPYKNMTRSNTLKQQQQITNDFSNHAQMFAQNTEEIKQALLDHYSPENYTPEELDAISAFTDNQYYDINNTVSQLPPNVNIRNPELPLNGADNTISVQIANIDKALNKVTTPGDFAVYVCIGPNIDISQLQSGSIFTFKSFRSSSLDMNVALDFSNKAPKSLTRDQTVLLQIKVPSGSKGMYVDDYSSNPGEAEFIFPRGTKVRVVSGPEKLVGADERSARGTLEVLYFNCEIVK